MLKFLTICLSTTIQRTINFPSVTLEAVNRSDKYRIDASGKAINTARVLNQLEKSSAKIICPLGINNKDEFLSLIKKDDLEIEYTQTSGNIRECWTLLDSCKKTTTELVVSEPLLNGDFKQNEDEILQKIDDNVSNINCIILSGSKPLIWSEKLVVEIAKRAITNKKIFLADYCGKDLINTINNYVPSIIKINDEEFCKTFNLEFPIKDNLLKEKIIKKSEALNNIIVVTRGIKSTYAAENGIFYECAIEKVQAINTTACGDSFNAGFIFEYLSSKDISASLKKGTWCAARNAERECPGTII